jgi:peptide/nickel transport system substrate-binding protein
MKRKLSWLVVSGMIVLALVLASCGPAVTEEEEEEVVTEEEEEVAEEEEEEEEEGPEMVLDSLGRLVEKPKYGGTFKYPRTQDPIRFDDVFGVIHNAPTMYVTNEDLCQGDWSKGPTGTGEGTWRYTMLPPPHLWAGGIAESWERPDDSTIIFHIRQGVHFHDKPPTNGREVTADDVVFSFKRLWETPTQWRHWSYPWDTMFESLEAVDKWTVVVKHKEGIAGPLFEFLSDHSRIVPREAIEMYGDLGDWKNSVGTGAFMLVDYVQGSSTTFERHPNYWNTDPLHPENQLPYLDELQWLVIPDASTRMAAMRTGKIDWLGLGWEDAGELIRTSPEIEYVKYLSGSCSDIGLRMDKPELPTYDVKVRRALSMALDRQAMIDSIYGGDAEILVWPVAPIPEFKDMFTPLDEMPEVVREQFEYNPDKARQLLAEAGFPDGFKCEVVAYSAYADLLSIVKAMWADIGVDMTIDMKEYGAWNAVWQNKSYQDMVVYGKSGTIPTTMIYTKPGNMYNTAVMDDPIVNAAYGPIQDAIFDWDLRSSLMKDITVYILEQAPYVLIPGPYSYYFWQPWVKSYTGELQVGYSQGGDFPRYIWIDQDLKEEMTGLR